MAEVHVVLDLGSPASQTLWVEMRWLPDQPVQRWTLPVWTPGSYTVRDPSQHLHSLSLEQTGQALVPTRRSPSSWQVDCECNQPLILRYALEARQLTVRTNLLDPSFASLCLSAVVMLVEGQRWTPHRMKVVTPSHWSVACPLPNHDDGYVAEDFDHLVDAPVHAGVIDTRSLTVREQPHHLVLIGAPPSG